MHIYCDLNDAKPDNGNKEAVTGPLKAAESGNHRQATDSEACRALPPHDARERISSNESVLLAGEESSPTAKMCSQHWMDT